MYESAWSPTAMPRRESEHAFLHPRYDGGLSAFSASSRPAAQVIEERKIREEVTLSVEPHED